VGTVQRLYLYQLAKDGSPDGRTTFAKEISVVFLDNNPSLMKREWSLMYEILQHLLHYVKISVPKSVSEQFSEAEVVHRELAKLLANDKIQVAFPILSSSDALFDEDLIEIIHTRTVEHQFAITKRPRVGETVTDVTVGSGLNMQQTFPFPQK